MVVSGVIGVVGTFASVCRLGGTYYVVKHISYV